VLEASTPIGAARVAAKIGFNPFTQSTTWQELRAAVQLAEQVRYDSTWIDDHLLSDLGSADQPKLEAWTTLAALAASTETIRLGHLVTSVHFRNPALLAKMAAMADQISNGRFILGLGAGWYGEECHAFGITFPQRVQDRLQALRETAQATRALLAGEECTVAGAYVTTNSLKLSPPPLQDPLPILIGGSGEKVLLRIVAEHADLSNFFLDPPCMAQRLAALDAHLDTVGRNRNEVARTMSTPPVVLREDPIAAKAILSRQFLMNQSIMDTAAEQWATTPDLLIAALQPYMQLGVSHIMLGVLAPFDHETIERFARDVRPNLVQRA
jgi:alkanesulfonate monooxygenase SsuD/methylene tetrahydromethanopterin reductase-like flavin-dependent oxidoreductase (luciferase family)